MSILATTAMFGTKVRRAIDNSPEFTGVQTSDNGRPEAQAPAGGILTG
ncbi:hypothetical protein C491_07441 [Natronococcus amylolyticus DSM 10524]|uniref:Uncharacterized protein n=2 Tax=Natronococcus amylolyticus TaxID=44470 RepID=L9XCJ8_9EURY|nr:hypothetical protein C491_07441 [Natronococcus amylolyticus DSM 10524]